MGEGLHGRVALRCVDGGWRIRDEGAASACGGKNALALERGIGALHRVQIDAQDNRDLAHSGKLRAGHQHAAPDRLHDLLAQLNVDGNTGVVQAQPGKHHTSIVCIHSYKLTPHADLVKKHLTKAAAITMTKYKILRLKPHEGKRVRAGAPWAFSNEITMDAAAKTLEPGSPVRLAESDGTLIGTGYFNPKSLIAVRLMGPPGAEIDRSFFTAKLRRALALRERFYQRPYYRLVHAEGDGLPGLIVDRYGDALVVQIGTAGMEMLTDDLLAALDEIVAPRTMVLRNDAPSRALEGLDSYIRVAKGDVPTRVAVEENGARYLADLQSGQKSGWYYDQRDNRAFMAGLASGQTVLDAFCYTGGFSVLAALKGARSVTGIDSSEPALNLAREAAAANGVEQRCEFVKADVLAELDRRATKERFGIVICDPPPFVRARKDLESGARAYRKLARLAATVTAPGGFLFLTSCSHNMPHERFLSECAAGIARAGRAGALIRDAGAGPDHPVHPQLPESAYLKALVYALD